MKKLLVLILLLFSGAVHALSTVCLPNSSSAPIDQVGGKLMEGRDNVIKGDWYALWCPKPDGGWVLKLHAVLDKYKTLSAATVFQLGLQIWSSNTPMTALQNMINTYEVLPPAGTQERFDWETLLYQACMQGRNVPPAPDLVITGACLVPTPLLPPTAPTVAYAVTSTAAYPVRTDGTRDTRAAATPATLGSTCDCSVETGKKIVNPFGGQWCKVTVPGATVLLVAGCSVKK